MFRMDEFVLYSFLSSIPALGGWSLRRHSSSSGIPLGVLSFSFQVLWSWVKVKGMEKMVKSFFTEKVCPHFSVVVVASALPECWSTPFQWKSHWKAGSLTCYNHKIFLKLYWGLSTICWGSVSLQSLSTFLTSPFLVENSLNLFPVGNLYSHVQRRTDKMTLRLVVFCNVMKNSLHSSCGCANISLYPTSLSLLALFIYLLLVSPLASDMAISERDPAFPFSLHPQSLWESLLEVLSPHFGDEKPSLTWTFVSAGWHPYFLGIPQLSQCFFYSLGSAKDSREYWSPLVSLG